MDYLPLSVLLVFGKKRWKFCTQQDAGPGQFTAISETTYFYRKVSVYMVIYRHKYKVQHKILLQNW